MAECWTCGAERGAARFCTTCGKIQPVGGEPRLFEALGLEPRMAVSRDQVEKAFREASKEVHPDRFGQASSVERKLALQNTERVNDAYRTLKDPRRRAEHLMARQGVEVGAETSKTKDPAFLMEMMELGERVDESDDDDALEALQADLKARYDRHLAALTSYFDEGRGEQGDAVFALEELRYLERLLERIDTKLEEMY